MSCDLLRKTIRGSALIVFLFIYPYLDLMAGDSQNASMACVHLEQGRRILQTGSLEDAKILFTQSATVFAKERSWMDWYDCLSGLYQIAKAQKDFTSYEGYLTQQFELVQKADLFVQARYYFLYSYVLKFNGNIYRSIQIQKKSLSLYEILKDERAIRNCLQNLGIYYSNFNDHQLSLYYGQLLLSRLDSSDVERRKEIYELLSTYSYFLDEFENSVQYADSALYLADEPITSVLRLKIRSLAAMNKFTQVDSLLNILEQYETDQSTNNNLMSELDFIQGRAREAYAKRKRISAELKNGRDIRSYAISLQKQAEIEYSLGDFKESLASAHSVLQLLCNNFETDDIYTLPNKKQTIPEAWVVEALYTKAICFAAIDRSNHSFEADQSNRAYDLAVHCLNLLRTQYSVMGSKYNMTEKVFKIFGEAVDYNLRMYTKGDSYDYVNKAFTYAQIAKSYNLKTIISERKAMQLAGVPRALSEQYFALVNQRSSISEQYLEISDSLTQVKNIILQRYPSLEETLDAQPVNIANVQSKLLNNQGLVHYFLYDQQLTSFLITKGNLHVFKRRLPEDFNEIVTEYSRCLKDVNYIDKHYEEAEKKYVQNAHLIYKNLLEEEWDKMEEVDHVMIVPDQYLSNISFSNLIIEPSQSWLSLNKYVLSHKAISYLYTTAEILDWKTNRQKVKRSTCIGWDYGVSSRKDESIAMRGSLDDGDFEPLPFVKQEVEKVAGILNAEPVLNKKATWQRLISQLNSSDLIHIAGHSLVDLEDPMESFIPVYNESGELIPLTYADVSCLTIDPHLVVLSACNTSNGKSIPTEGVISMSRAFAESGAGGTLGSLWNAPDEISQTIITSFYEYLQNGCSKATALQRAQLKFLSDDELSAPAMRIPAYWSNWEFFGNPAAVEFQHYRGRLIFFVLISMGMLCTFWLLRKKFNK